MQFKIQNMKKQIFCNSIRLFYQGACTLKRRLFLNHNWPQVVQKILQNISEKKEISNIVKDREDGRIVYEAYFTDYTEAEFTNKGELKEVKAKSIPTALIPQRLMSYVKKIIKEHSVTHWEKTDGSKKLNSIMV